MSQNTRAQDSGQDGDLRRNNPPQYNHCPLPPRVEEQRGDEPPPMARRRTTRHQPLCEMRTKHLEQRIDMLTELVNTLVMVLGQNAANATPAILPGIPLANAKGEEGLPLQRGRDIVAGEAQTDIDACRRRARRRHRTRHQSRGNAPELHALEHTRDLVFSRLERMRADPNLDDGYDFEYERSAGSRENTDLRAQLNARRRGLSSKLRAGPLSEQRLRRSTCRKCRHRLISC